MVSASLDVRSGLQASPAVAPPGVAAPWRMPRPTLGTVMWRNQDASGGECYALVTAVHGSMIDLMLFPGNSLMPTPRFGVKHVSDPSLARMKVPNPGGVWDFCPGEKEIRGVIEGQLKIIDDLFARLEARDAEAAATDDDYEGGLDDVE